MEKFKVFIQVLDDASCVRFNQAIEVPAEICLSPDEGEVNMHGVKNAVDFELYTMLRRIDKPDYEPMRGRK